MQSGIILPRRSNNLLNTNAAFKNYAREEVINITYLELFLILFPVEYKNTLIPETHKLLKHIMDLREFIRWMGCWFYMGFWVRISKRRNWWSTADLKMSGGAPLRLNKYMSRTNFEGIHVSLRYTDQKDLEYYDGFFHMRKTEEAWNLNMDEDFNPSCINLLD